MLPEAFVFPHSDNPDDTQPKPGNEQKTVWKYSLPEVVPGLQSVAEAKAKGNVVGIHVLNSPLLAPNGFSLLGITAGKNSGIRFVNPHSYLDCVPGSDELIQYVSLPSQVSDAKTSWPIKRAREIGDFRYPYTVMQADGYQMVMPTCGTIGAGVTEMSHTRVGSGW